MLSRDNTTMFQVIPRGGWDGSVLGQGLEDLRYDVDVGPVFDSWSGSIRNKELRVLSLPCVS